MRFRLSSRFRKLLYLFGLLLAFCAAAVQFAPFAKFGVSNVIYGIIKFVNPKTVSTAGTIYGSIQVFLGYMFYLAFIVLIVVSGIIVWDFFRKKPDEESAIHREVIFALDFSKMTPKRIAEFMDRLKDMSSAQIETLLGGQYAKAIKEATKHPKESEPNKEKTSKTKGKKGGKAQDK